MTRLRDPSHHIAGVVSISLVISVVQPQPNEGPLQTTGAGISASRVRIRISASRVRIRSIERTIPLRSWMVSASARTAWRRHRGPAAVLVRGSPGSRLARGADPCRACSTDSDPRHDPATQGGLGDRDPVVQNVETSQSRSVPLVLMDDHAEHRGSGPSSWAWSPNSSCDRAGEVEASMRSRRL